MDAILKTAVSVLLTVFISSCGSETLTQMKSNESTPAVVEFRIPNGTGAKAWNTAETMVKVKLNDTLRIFNDDADGSGTLKLLHTNGKPCGHGTKNIAVGASYDCIISVAYNPDADGVIYNHHVGPEAAFYVKTVE